jgi:hypothetical protein
MAQSRLSSVDHISLGHSSWSEIICWSRMQAEAGQQLQEIVHRKELERVANEGLFCWGVGNAPNRCTAGFARDRVEVDALFSIMKSRPKMVDIAPATTVIWRRFIDFDGRERTIPRSSLVTSRGESQNKLKRSHFALFCRTDSPLVLGDFGSFDPSAYRNVGEVGGSIGPSQVTALLRRTAQESSEGASYRINLKAKMFGSYWAKLTDPIPMDIDKQQALSWFVANQAGATSEGWTDLVQQLRDKDRVSAGAAAKQMHLF